MHIWLSEYNEKCSKSRLFFYKWTTADQMENGFSSNNRYRRAENTPGQHHTLNYLR